MSAELLPFIVGLIAAGLFAGFIGGLFGVGGGVVIVPALYVVFTYLGVDEAVRMHLSVGSSIAIIVPTSISSFRGHLARGVVDTALLRTYVPSLTLGVVLASLTAASISSFSLRVIFAAMIFLFGLRMLLNRQSWRLGDDVPGNPWRFGAGTIIGYLSTLMGIGGGQLSNLFMTLYGRPIHQAVATSAGLGVLISIPGALIGYIWAGWGNPMLPPLSLGYVSVVGAAIIIPMSVLAAPLGVRAAHGMSRRALELAFAAFLALVATRLLMSLL